MGLEINDEGITYTAPHAKHGAQWLGTQHIGHALDRLDNRPYSLSWKWDDIQYFDRLSRKEFVLLTYHDDWRFLGKDEQYRLNASGEGPLSHGQHASKSHLAHRVFPLHLPSQPSQPCPYIERAAAPDKERRMPVQSHP